VRRKLPSFALGLLVSLATAGGAAAGNGGCAGPARLRTLRRSRTPLVVRARLTLSSVALVIFIVIPKPGRARAVEARRYRTHPARAWTVFLR
jgi:hypothetical protein